MKQEENFNNYYKKWLESNKRFEFLKQMEDKKDNTFYTKDQLISWCKKINQFNDLEENEKIKQEFEADIHNKINDIATEIKKYTKLQVNLHYYLKKYVGLEDYELCSYIRDTIAVSELEFVRRIVWYYKEEDEINALVEQVYLIKDEARIQLGV